MSEILQETQEMQEEKKKKKPSLAREVANFVIYILAILLMTWLIVHFVGQRTEVNGNSMETTLSNRDNLIVDKLTYRFRDPQRFDIIVFPYRYKDRTYYIKRIIALPTERVYIDVKGRIYVNGEVLEEHYGMEAIEASKRLLAADEIHLAEDEYFVLGDNRNASSDSRDPSVGNVSHEIIIGRAWLRIYPLNKIGFIRHQ